MVLFTPKETHVKQAFDLTGKVAIVTGTDIHGAHGASRILILFQVVLVVSASRLFED